LPFQSTPAGMHHGGGKKVGEGEDFLTYRRGCQWLAVECGHGRHQGCSKWIRERLMSPWESWT